MRNLRRVLVVLGGVVGCASTGAVAEVGCGGDDTHALPIEAGSDVTTMDTFRPDVQVNETSTQDVVDSGVADVDAAVAIPPFLTEVATAFCNKVAACCAAQLPDGAAFDSAACIAVNTGVGYQGTALGAGVLLGAGTLSYDSAKAAACLNDINAIDCTGNVITTTQQKTILTDCTAAVFGTFAAGATCTESVECAAGMFCATASDGGPAVGTCVPLRGDGGACGDFGDIPLETDYGLSEEACSYRRTGNTGLRCDNADPNTGAVYDGGPAVWTCKPAADIDGGCNFDQDCTSGLCDPGPPGYPFVEPEGGVVAGGVKYLCAGSVPFAYPNACLAFVK